MTRLLLLVVCLYLACSASACAGSNLPTPGEPPACPPGSVCTSFDDARVPDGGAE